METDRKRKLGELKDGGDEPEQKAKIIKLETEYLAKIHRTSGLTNRNTEVEWKPEWLTAMNSWLSRISIKTIVPEKYSGTDIGLVIDGHVQMIIMNIRCPHASYGHGDPAPGSCRILENKKYEPKLGAKGGTKYFLGLYLKFHELRAVPFNLWLTSMIEILVLFGFHREDFNANDNDFKRPSWMENVYHLCQEDCHLAIADMVVGGAEVVKVGWVNLKSDSMVFLEQHHLVNREIYQRIMLHEWSTNVQGYFPPAMSMDTTYFQAYGNVYQTSWIIDYDFSIIISRRSVDGCAISIIRRRGETVYDEIFKYQSGKKIVCWNQLGNESIIKHIDFLRWFLLTSMEFGNSLKFSDTRLGKIIKRRSSILNLLLLYLPKDACNIIAEYRLREEYPRKIIR